MNCADPVRDRLVDATDQTVVTSNQAAVAASLRRDRTALHVSAFKLRTRELRSARISPRTPAHDGPAEQACGSSPDSQPSQCSLGRVLRASAANPQARSGVSLTPSSKPPPRRPATWFWPVGGRDRTTTGRKMMIMPRVTVKSEVVPLMYRVDEAATALRLSRSSVYELIRSGQLRTVKQGRRRLVPVTALAEYVASLGGAA
jgi:excisionase family DNA binding protein